MQGFNEGNLVSSSRGERQCLRRAYQAVSCGFTRGVPRFRSGSASLRQESSVKRLN